MDIDRTIHEMEQAANILLNPYQSSRDYIKMSENVFITFSKSQLTIPQCFDILEKTRVELILFETVKMIKNILIYEWRGLNDEDKIVMRQKLLDYVLNNPNLPSSVIERVLQIVAIMVKRKFLEDGGDELKGLLETIKGMIFGSQDNRVQQVSCAIIVSILQEFTNTVKSEDVVLSFEEHFRAKKIFEARELLLIFQLIFDAIERILPILDISNATHFIMLESSLKIMELVLSWSYITALIPKRIIKAFESLNNIKQQPSLRLSALWQPMMLQRHTIEVFFSIYWRVRDHPVLQQKGINCLIQLSTLSGPIFSIANSSFQYFQDYVELLMMMLKNCDVNECEAFGISTIIRKLLMIHNVKTELSRMNEALGKEFLGAMVLMTVKFIEMSVKENLSYGDTVYTDASKSMLEAWLDVINVTEIAFTEEVHHHARIIFDRFIECHTSGGGSEQEVNENEESEREAYKEQLIIIGFLGRLNVEHSLRQVALHMEEKLNLLCTSMDNPDSVTKIFDALTWLIMIAGHVLTMDSIGEKPLIPREINQLSMQLAQEQKIDAQSTQSTLHGSVQLQQPHDKCDPAVRLLSNVLRLCEMENRAIESGFGATWSPLLSSTIMWFIGMYTSSYILIDATYYNPLAPIYQEMFIVGSAVPASSWCMNFIINKVAWNLHKYHHDVDVVDESIRLFLDIVNIRNQKLPHVFELESFQNLIHLRDLHLDSRVKRNVYKGLIMVTAAFRNIEQRQACLRHLLEPIGARFDSVFSEGQQMIHETATREKILIVLDELTGVAQGINGSTFPFVYQIMRERFQRLPDMMLVWRNYLDINCAVMKVLIEMTTIQVVTSGAIELSREFYEVCFRAMKNYMEQQGQRIEKIYGEDEEQPEDILTFVELFKKLTIQYMFEQANQNIVTNLGITILSNLMPKMYPILERFPDIAIAYYKSLICFVELLACNNELHHLPIEILNHILYTIKIGLTSFTYPEIQGHSLDLLITFGDSMIQDVENKLVTLKELTIEPFGKLLFDVIVGLNLHSENKNDCYGAIYLLGCAAQSAEANFCHEMVTALVSKQKERVTYATEADTPEVEKLKAFVFNHSREQKMNFIDLLDKFVSSICFLYHQE